MRQCRRVARNTWPAFPDLAQDLAEAWAYVSEVGDDLDGTEPSTANSTLPTTAFALLAGETVSGSTWRNCRRCSERRQ
jgi:hypothetical protein